MGNPVTHFEVVGKDAAALQRFYGGPGYGGSRVMGPVDVPDGPSIALFADPEGHVVGLLEAGSRRR